MKEGNELREGVYQLFNFLFVKILEVKRQSDETYLTPPENGIVQRLRFLRDEGLGGPR